MLERQTILHHRAYRPHAPLLNDEPCVDLHIIAYLLHNFAYLLLGSVPPPLQLAPDPVPTDPSSTMIMIKFGMSLRLDGDRISEHVLGKAPTHGCKTASTLVAQHTVYDIREGLVHRATAAPRVGKGPADENRQRSPSQPRRAQADQQRIAKQRHWIHAGASRSQSSILRTRCDTPLDGGYPPLRFAWFRPLRR